MNELTKYEQDILTALTGKKLSTEFANEFIKGLNSLKISEKQRVTFWNIVFENFDLLPIEYFPIINQMYLLSNARSAYLASELNDNWRELGKKMNFVLDRALIHTNLEDALSNGQKWLIALVQQGIIISTDEDKTLVIDGSKINETLQGTLDRNKIKYRLK